MTETDAVASWGAVSSAQRLMPVRVACLETSVALVLFAALCRRSLDWCVGVRLGPFESHAWVEAAGEPVREPDRVRLFHKILTV